MSNTSKLALLKEIIESAESSLRSAKNILNEIAGDSGQINKLEQMAEKVSTKEKTGQHQIIEGVFDGQNMIGPDKKKYSVPANYASKSKLVQGDILKLTITQDGSFLYKQIGPVPRKKIIGTLTYEDGQYKVIAGGRAFKVLLASVTYFKAEIGDRVTIIIPELEDSDWAAIENVIPKEENLDDFSDLDDIDQLPLEDEEDENPSDSQENSTDKKK